MVIYLIVNKVNGKYYVGKTIHSLDLRWRQHCNDAKTQVHRGNSPIDNAILKYGQENFDVHPLITTLTTDEELKRWEIFLIALFRARDSRYGYNVTRGGDGVMAGRKATEEHKAKLRARFSGNSNPFFGKKHTEATRQKMCEAQARREDKKNGLYLKTCSNGGKKGAATLWAEGTRKSARPRRNGWAYQTERKQTQSERSKALWQNPAYRESVVSNLRKHFNDPQVKEALRAKAELQWSDPEKRKQAAAFAKAGHMKRKEL